MAATRDEISAWFDKGVCDGKRYMLVICDTFDWDDYPIYYNDEKAARGKMISPGEMQKFMEAYDLSNEKAPQIAARRVNCFQSADR